MAEQRKWAPGECDLYGPGDVEPMHCVTFLVQPGDAARYAGASPVAVREFGLRERALPSGRVPIRGGFESLAEAELAADAFADVVVVSEDGGRTWREANDG